MAVKAAAALLMAVAAAPLVPLLPGRLGPVLCAAGSGAFVTRGTCCLIYKSHRPAPGEPDGGELALPVVVDQVQRGRGHPGDGGGDPDHGLELRPGRRVEDAVGVQCRQAVALDELSASAWAVWARVDSWLVYFNYDNSLRRRESARAF